MNENINTSELLEVFPEDFLDALEEKHDPFAHGQGAIPAMVLDCTKRLVSCRPELAESGTVDAEVITQFLTNHFCI
ncbi:MULTISPECIES: hypothetical protein [Vibrio]|uniref:hypothetical protein n=1 Tax=Vibrio TaxID=662 RepID=UPI00111CEBE4|nr:MULTISPECIES: hypothetical protein [Vibrio]EJL6928471.1 hypothetical protein [Vibrio alginolyticus]MBS9976474.1 hypothetical protein [Vibrio alginolyticus]MBT0022554.1 hypothetical protein [Vibrio alginolyticus]MCR9962001.1 hypothetical protein [Vibrio alginolyticus]MCS0235791.1 hypothetical protein [Vibrio alginolyticus]